MPPIQNTTSQRDSPRKHHNHSMTNLRCLRMWFLDHNLQLSKFFHLYLLGCLPYRAVQFHNIGRYRLQPYSGNATPTTQPFRINHPPFTISDLHILPLNHSTSAGSQVSAFSCTFSYSDSLSLSPVFHPAYLSSCWLFLSSNYLLHDERSQIRIQMHHVQGTRKWSFHNHRANRRFSKLNWWPC
jgi:hypothetical protein